MEQSRPDGDPRHAGHLESGSSGPHLLRMQPDDEQDQQEGEEGDNRDNDGESSQTAHPAHRSRNDDYQNTGQHQERLYSEG